MGTKKGSVAAILANESLYTLPEFLSGTSAWEQHIPFAFLLVQLANPGTIVELGTHKGDSYLAFCQSAKALKLNTRCFAVDHWLGEEHAGQYGEDVYNNLHNYHEPRYGSFSKLVRLEFNAASKTFEDGSVDILHIDGLHTYEAVKGDFLTWRSKLSERAVVLFHDTQVLDRGFGVWRLWEELSKQYPHFEFKHASGLGVVGIGKDLSEPLQTLFSLSEVDTNVLRYIVQALGHRLSLYGSNQRLESTLVNLMQEIKAKDSVITASASAENLLSLTETVAKIVDDKNKLEENNAQLAQTGKLLYEANRKLTSEKTALEDRLNIAENTIKEVENSWSWKLTQPMRSIKRFRE